ncbi:MAG TPA: hypothetical protein VHY34_01135 [Caulobacteraceae bacterium]|jgi:hypothetical protein|nr:hypothetical protein [Caulobacteraceae bacterium]
MILQTATALAAWTLLGAAAQAASAPSAPTNCRDLAALAPVGAQLEIASVN